jgi:tRNA pseudouridine55 synthase
VIPELERRDGAVLRVDKPVGPTSHDAVAQVRRALNVRRVGHTGTLDPFASGLLLVCLGSATRLAEYLTPLTKTYLATLRLGIATDTDDRMGEVVADDPAGTHVPRAALEAALSTQRGTIRQLPPVYSAKKVGGQRMYAAARRGETLERTPVEVTIHRIELLEYRAPDAVFEVECSSGTYIRAIARDVGDALGVGAHLRELRRTRVGVHDVSDAVALDRLAELGAGSPAWLSPAAALRHLPRHVLSAAEQDSARHGRAVAAAADLPYGTPLVLLDESEHVVAIAERRADSLHPRKVLA